MAKLLSDPLGYYLTIKGVDTYYSFDTSGTDVVTETLYGDGSGDFKNHLGLLHREDGPALISLDGKLKSYYLHGEIVPEEEYGLWRANKEKHKSSKARYSSLTMTPSEKKDYFNGTDNAGQLVWGATGPVCASGPSPVNAGIVGATGVSMGVTGVAIDCRKAIPTPVVVEPTSQEELANHFLNLAPSLSMAVEEEINYAKYQKQIKEKAEEFLKSFDNGKFAKKVDDHKAGKLEELKQKVEDLKKDREEQVFVAELATENKKASAPPLDVFALNRCAFNVDIKDFLRWTSEDAQQVKAAFDQYTETGNTSARTDVESKIIIANNRVVVDLEREQTKIAEDLKDIKNKVNAILDQESVQSYSEMSNFVGALINIGVVSSKDFIGQVDKCERWSNEDYKTIRLRTNSYIKGDLTASFTEVKTLIAKANDAVALASEEKVSIKNAKNLRLSVSPGITNVFIRNNYGTEICFQFTKNLSKAEKSERLSNILMTGGGQITEQTLLGISTPELTTEDIHYWMDHYFMGGDLPTPDPHVVTSKKQIRTNKDVEKITRLLADNKIQIKDLDKYVALGIISSAGLKAWRIQDQANNNYFYNNWSEEPVFTDAEISSAIEEISDEEFKQLVGLTIPTRFESEIRKAAFRVAGTQVNNVTRAAIIKALPDDKAEGMKAFLASELGSSFVGMVGGITLTHAMESNDIAQDLAKELRVSSMTTLGNEACGVLTKGMIGIIKGAVMELPEISKVISVDNESVEEELELLREEQIQQKMMN